MNSSSPVLDTKQRVEKSTPDEEQSQSPEFTPEKQQKAKGGAGDGSGGRELLLLSTPRKSFLEN